MGEELKKLEEELAAEDNGGDGASSGDADEGGNEE